MPHHVGIIGAGVSGLRCAEILLEHGHRITILEARNRLGGRITQSDEFGTSIDIGAHWVHSTASNPIINIAADTNTPLHTWDPTTILIDSAGEAVPEALANTVLARVWDILEEAVERSKTHSNEIPPSESLYDYFERACHTRIAKGDIEEHERDLILGMAHMWGAYVGEAVERQSMRFFFLEDCIHEDDKLIATTYEKIMERIAAPAVAGARIQLNTEVTSIDVNAGNANTPRSIAVTSSTSETSSTTQIFDAVVITLPLGYLQHHPSIIKPLTPRLHKAIHGLGYGRLEKVFVSFPTAFWDDERRSPMSFMHWLPPAYSTSTNPNRWKLEAVSLAALESPHTRPILLFYIFGACSAYLAEQTHALSADARYDFLAAFFQPYIARLPRYDATAPQCKPERFLATTWCRDKYSGYGSYSNFPVGAEDAAGDVRALRRGMPEMGIFFAGEHVAPEDGLGTVAGAYEAGEAVARRIVSGEEGVNGV